MNKITFVLLTVIVTLFTGFLGLIPMLIIGFNMFGEKKVKTKKKWLIHKWQVVAITIVFGLGTFYQESLVGAMVNGMLAAYVYYWANERYKRNIEGQ